MLELQKGVMFISIENRISKLPIQVKTVYMQEYKCKFPNEWNGIYVFALWQYSVLLLKKRKKLVSL